MGRVSAATDPKFTPLGAPVFLSLDRADATGLWVAQDTGGAGGTRLRPGHEGRRGLQRQPGFGGLSEERLRQRTAHVVGLDLHADAMVQVRRQELIDHIEA